MRKSLFFMMFLALCSTLLLLACDDGSKDEFEPRVRALEGVQKKGCFISLVTSECKDNNVTMYKVKCSGESVGGEIDCPAGNKCISVSEFHGDVSYCVAENANPECVISSCDAKSNLKLKECNNGKWEEKYCSANEVCRAVGKEIDGSDMTARCTPNPDLNGMDPCVKAGYARLQATKCAKNNEYAVMTCGDGYMLTESCHGEYCEGVNVKQKLLAFAENIEDTKKKSLLTATALRFSDEELHGCKLNTRIDELLTLFAQE